MRMLRSGLQDNPLLMTKVQEHLMFNTRSDRVGQTAQKTAVLSCMVALISTVYAQAALKHYPKMSPMVMFSEQSPEAHSGNTPSQSSDRVGPVKRYTCTYTESMDGSMEALVSIYR